MKALHPLLALILGTALTASAQPTAAILPFEPAQILAILPPAPADWSTTRSEAETTMDDWLETRATRVFRGPQPAAANDPAPASATPAEVEISVTDTTGFAPFLAAFAGFVPGKSGNVEKKQIGALPAIIFTGDDGRQLTQVLVSNRYVIEVSTSQPTRFRVEDWLRGFHFDALPTPSTVPTTPPHEFRLSHIDELHPKNNRSYAVSATNSARVSAFLKSLPTAAVESRK